MARAFDEKAERTTLRLPLLTKQQITALMLDLSLDLTETIIRAVSDLWHREIGEAPRDIYAELDAIKAKLGMTD